jgi:hypothetical protein
VEIGPKDHLMITRRVFWLSGLSLLPFGLPETSRAQGNDRVEVRIRTDDTVQGALPPIALDDVSVTVDQSQAAQELASRVPPTRAVPVILIIAGALAIGEIAQLVKEMVREFYYGGVIIDGRKSPPEIQNSPTVPANMVFVFLPDGTLREFKSGEIPSEVFNLALGHKA